MTELLKSATDLEKILLIISTINFIALIIADFKLASLTVDIEIIKNKLGMKR